jgi:hypothetical protein
MERKKNSTKGYAMAAVTAFRLIVRLNSVPGNFAMIINHRKYPINLNILMNYSKSFRKLFETGNYTGEFELEESTEDIEQFMEFVNTRRFLACSIIVTWASFSL